MKSKKGFTLLETLLSVALLLIISTMMMNGFMSTINYSHNTSVQAKSSASNYASAMSDLAQYTAEASLDKQVAYQTLDSSGTEYKLKITGGSVAGSNLILNSDERLKVRVFKYIDNTTDLHDNLGLPEYNEHYTPDEDNSYADNRYSYTYIPYVNKTADDKYIGEVRIYLKNSTKEYWWGYKDEHGNIVTISKVA